MLRASFVILLLTLSVLPAQAVDNNSATTPPNIVLILADDLGWSDVGCFGNKTYETPHIDALAASGIRFTNSYAACNVCSPTRASLMTGKYPARLHLTDYIPGGKDRGLISPKWRKYLPTSEVTIAERLHELGYVCGHFGKWHLNKDKNYRAGREGDPGSQGFDTVLATVKPASNADPTADPHHVQQITTAALKFIDSQKEQPFFCYVTHNSVHRPLIANPERVARQKELNKTRATKLDPVYAAMMEELDESVGTILAHLDERNLADNTVVIFTSDNGGYVSKLTNNLPLRAGKGTNYEGGIRVPTVVRWPGVVQPGSQSDIPIITSDFFATLEEIAGGKDKPNRKAAGGSNDGVSIVPLLQNASPTITLAHEIHLREALYWHYPHYHSLGATPHGIIRQGAWKLIEFYDDGHLELYNLQTDLGEQHDLSGSKQARAVEMQKMLQTWRQEVAAQMPTRPTQN